MKSWIQATLSLLTLALWAGSVSAAELKPNNATQPALIRGGPAGAAWYAVPEGGALTFDVMGPATLEVELVQRLPSGNTGPKAQVRAKGDGMDILAVKVAGEVGQGSIMDGFGGVPSVVGKAKINVPAGQHVFSLEPTSGSLPILARVDAPESALIGVTTVVASTTEDIQPVIRNATPAPAAEEPTAEAPTAEAPTAEAPTAEAPTAEAPTAEAPAAEAPTAEAPTAEEPTLVEAAPEPELDDDLYWDDDAFGGPSIAEDSAPTTAGPPDPSAELSPSAETPTTDPEPKFWVGARTGLGSAQAGNQASMYLGLELLYNLDVPNVHLGARLGRYGIGLEQELAIQPPIGGTATALTLDWSTRVRPLELGARYTVPIGGIHAYGWGALAAYSATRIDGQKRIRGASIGTSWAMGLDFGIGPGMLSPELAFNLGSRDFGNLNSQGQAARERLSSSRLNLAYRIAF